MGQLCSSQSNMGLTGLKQVAKGLGPSGGQGGVCSLAFSGSQRLLIPCRWPCLEVTLPTSVSVITAPSVTLTHLPPSHKNTYTVTVPPG